MLRLLRILELRCVLGCESNCDCHAMRTCATFSALLRMIESRYGYSSRTPLSLYAVFYEIHPTVHTSPSRSRRMKRSRSLSYLLKLSGATARSPSLLARILPPRRVKQTPGRYGRRQPIVGKTLREVHTTTTSNSKARDLSSRFETASLVRYVEWTVLGAGEPAHAVELQTQLDGGGPLLSSQRAPLNISLERCGVEAQRKVASMRT